MLEVYLKDAPGDERQVAALAPPWSTVPWHLLALMEEAVIRGYAAFSQAEATRRRVPWLDLVRDQALRAKLHDSAAQFERERYRPESLKDFVTADEAQARWRALRVFAEKNGHFLVANGPYRLKAWTPGSVVLEAVREITYPLGFGTFDRFVNPPRALIEAATQEAGTITVRASAEMILKMGRKYQLVKEPLLRTTMRGVDGLLVVSRYLLIDPDGKVLKVDKMQWKEDGDSPSSFPSTCRRASTRSSLASSWTAIPASLGQDAARPPRRGGFAGLGANAEWRRCRNATTAGGAKMDILIIQILNSIFYAAVLFLIAAGLSLIYGVMRIVNLAHGTSMRSAPMSRPGRSARVRPARGGTLGADRQLCCCRSAPAIAAVGAVIEPTLLRPLYAGRRSTCCSSRSGC